MKKLLFCPALYHHDKGMWPPTISSTAYFLWQKNLWNILSDLKGWKVLWNAGQTNSNLYDPISKWKTKNIKYTRMRIQDASRNCDMALVDVPSTVMWDAKREGKPCLCISPREDMKWVRKDVLRNHVEIEFISCSQVKETLEDWLKGFQDPCISINKKDLFVINQNDWLKEITSA